MENRSARLRACCSGAVSALVVAILMVAATASTPGSGQMQRRATDGCVSGRTLRRLEQHGPAAGRWRDAWVPPTARALRRFRLDRGTRSGLPPYHPSATVKVDLTADNGTSDYDLYVLDESGQ